MGKWLVVIVTCCYTLTGFDQLIKGDWRMAGMWFCYAGANAFIMGKLS